jgi:hypothetical protein
MPRLIGFAAVALLAALAAGCSKKLTVDSSFTMPEGTPTSNLLLITQFDYPNAVINVKDRGRVGVPDFVPDTTNADSIIINPDTGEPEIDQLQEFTPFTVRGSILNQTSAEGMQMFRSSSSGGVYQFLDFVVPAQKRWLDRLAETYVFEDPDAGRTNGARYFARGLIGGVAGNTSPLSNGSQPLNNTIAQITYTANRNGTITPISGPPPPAESTFFMQWTTIPGAATYWIDVFQYLPTLIGFDERVFSGAPQVLAPLKSRDVFVASLPATGAAFMTYKLGDPPAHIYTYRAPHLHQEYYVRIAAVDAQGQLIGMTTGPTIRQTSDLLLIQDTRDYFFIFGTGTYQMFSRGAVIVIPGG